MAVGASQVFSTAAIRSFWCGCHYDNAAAVSALAAAVAAVAAVSIIMNRGSGRFSSFLYGRHPIIIV